MNSILLKPPNLQPTLLHIFSTFFRVSLEAPLQAPIFPTKHLQGVINQGEYDVVSWGVRRSNSELDENSSSILAEERTRRRDPLDHFRYYKGGWNISDKHYFYSVEFTAAPLLFIGALWFLGFGLCLFITRLQHCCFQRLHHGFSQLFFALALIILILFAIAAITGCIVLFIGQGKFHRSSASTLDFVVEQANITVEELRNVSKYLTAAKEIQVDQIFLPPNIQDNIKKVTSKITAAANTLDRETEKNKDKIKHILDLVRIALIIIAAVMLLLALLGVLFSVLGMQFLTYTVVLIGWILITITFVICGLFVILHSVIGDTCVAMDEWVQNPTAHTALDDIIPCVDRATAEDTLNHSKDVTIQLVGVVNTFITNISNRNFPPNAGSLYYNQSGPLVPVLCNPYNSGRTDHNCTSGEVNFDNAAEEWRRYICKVSERGICSTVGRLTPAHYVQMMSAVNLSYALYHYGPFLDKLGDCAFVRDIFTAIIKYHCPGLRCYSKYIYIALALVSVIFWLFYKREKTALGVHQTPYTYIFSGSFC
ncbi:hypothetical protein SLE2022_381220 [Rubroshorea leprosula]